MQRQQNYLCGEWDTFGRHLDFLSSARVQMEAKKRSFEFVFCGLTSFEENTGEFLRATCSVHSFIVKHAINNKKLSDKLILQRHVAKYNRVLRSKSSHLGLTSATLSTFQETQNTDLGPLKSRFWLETYNTDPAQPALNFNKIPLKRYFFL